MKRFLVIGLGHFGSWAARALYAQGHEVIAVDTNAELVDRHAGEVTRAVVADATDPELLRRIGADTVDAAIVSTGEDLAASILTTLALRDLGLSDIYVKVTSTAAARAVEALNVRATIFPEREAAERLAQHIVSTTVLDYVPLGGGYSIQQIAIPDRWLGRSLRELELPRRHGIQVVALHDMLTGTFNVVPDPDAPLKESDVAIVAGPDGKIAEILQRAT
ncbi:MAG: TrkA family potassium uptake protein [Gemmatimonadetes bacterium]|nr:TrkA family potassium uptake protein [Gemmatimonadota bacterium]